MKKAFLWTLLCLPAAVFAQGGKYIVEGTIGTYSAPAKVYLQYKTRTAFIVDSIAIEKGKFRFEGELTDDPIMAEIMLNPKGTGPSYGDAKQVYLENGVTTITGAGNMHDAAITGTQINLDNAKLDTAEKALDGDYEALNAHRNNATPEQQQSDSYRKESDRLLAAILVKRAAIYKKFIQDNPDSYISLVTLGGYAYSADYAGIAPLFDAMSDRMKKTVRGQHFAERLPHIKAVALGAIAPDITEADTTGNLINLSSFRGKYVLVDFWASWCGPCRQESPNLVRAFNHYRSHNFTIVGVSLDQPDGKSRWLAAIRKDGLAWTQVSDLKFWDSAAAQLYAVNAIPQNFLLDPNGKIIAKNLRGDDLENKLEELFGKI